MQPAESTTHYTIRTESGKVLQMSQEEMSQLVRKTMKRAKGKDDGSPRPVESSDSAQRRPAATSSSPEKRRQALVQTTATEGRDDAPLAERAADTNESQVEFHGNDDLSGAMQSTFESFTVNTELEGSKQLSQVELNMLVRNSIIKARQQTRAIQASSQARRQKGHEAKKQSSKNRHSKTRPQTNTGADETYTQQFPDESGFKENEVQADTNGQSDTVSVADTEPSQLTEPSALRRMTDEMAESKRGRSSASRPSIYLDSEEDVHEDVLRNARLMLRGMECTTDPIETIRNAHPLSPIADDEKTIASKESVKNFFPETPVRSHEPEAHARASLSNDHRSQHSKSSRSSGSSKPAKISKTLQPPLEYLATDEKEDFAKALEIGPEQVQAVMPASCSPTETLNSIQRNKHDSVVLHATSTKLSKSPKSSLLLKDIIVDEVMTEKEIPNNVQPEIDSTAVKGWLPSSTVESVGVPDSLGLVAKDTSEKDNQQVVESETSLDIQPPTSMEATPTVVAISSPTKNQTPRSRSLSRGKERLAQFYQRSKPKKQITPWTADPEKEKNRTDPEDALVASRDSKTLEPDDSKSKSPTLSKSRRKQVDPEEKIRPDSPRTKRRVAPMIVTENIASHEPDMIADRPFSEQEIENIVHLSMDKAQQTAREEIQEMLQESKRHKNKIGVRTADGYKLLSQDEIAGLVKESMRKAREAAQEEIAELVRDSMQQARESAQAEIKELVQDSMRRARESALKEMSDIVKESLRNARADDSTVVSTSAFTLNSVPAYRQGFDVLPVVPAIGSSQCSGHIHRPADTIPEEVMSGSVFEGVGSTEWREKVRHDVGCASPSETSKQCGAKIPQSALEERSTVEAPALETTLVLNGIEIRPNDQILSRSFDTGPQQHDDRQQDSSSNSDPDYDLGQDRYEVTAVVKKPKVQGTNLCFGFKSQSANSSIASENEQEKKTSFDNDFNEVLPIESSTIKTETGTKQRTGGTFFCGGSSPIAEDEPYVQEIAFVKQKGSSHGSRLSSGRWKNTEQSVEKFPSSDHSTGNTPGTKTKSRRKRDKGNFPRDNLAPMSPLGLTHASPTAYDRRNAKLGRNSRASKYSRGNSRRTEESSKAAAKVRKETVTVTDELLKEMATLKGATITQDELNKLLSRPRVRSEASKSNKEMKAKANDQQSGELEVADNRFCMNFMDLLSLDEDDEYTRAGSHSLASSLPYSRGTNWRGNTDLGGTFSATDNEYSIGQSFSPNEDSTFSEDDISYNAR